MRITTKITVSMLTGEVLEHQFYEYPDNSPLELCDRSAQAAAKGAAGTAGTVAGTEGANAQGEQARLNPFYTKEMNAEHLYDPTQTNELLTAAEAGSGGADSALVGDAALQAARTRNPSGFTKSLDEVARDRMKANAGASEGIAAQDVMGAKELNQRGAAGEAGLFGQNTDAQLKAMGVQTGDINAQVEAGKSGWLQNMEQTLASLGSLGKGAADFKNSLG